MKSIREKLFLKNILGLSGVVLLNLFLLPSATACDYCMCSYGVSPLQQDRIVIGLDYRFLDMNTMVINHSVIDNPFNIKETYSTFRLLGMIPLAGDFSLQLAIPISTHQLIAAQNDVSAAAGIGPNVSTSGLSDASALVSYRFLHAMEGSWMLSASMAGGLKFPTGASEAIGSDGNFLDPDLQVGTGSFDPMLNATLQAGSGLWGLSVNLFDWYPTKGIDGYRYGNSFTYEANAMYHVLPETFQSPNLFIGAGFGGELHGTEYQDGVAQDSTGGNSIYIAPAVRVMFDRFAINLRGQFFVLHNVNGEQLDYTFRALAGVQYQL